LTAKGGPVRMRAFDWKPGPRRQGHRTPRPRLVGTKGRLGVSRVTSWALAAATALFALGTAPAWATAAPLSPGAYRVAVAPAVHHDVSAPLRDIAPSRTPARAHPAKRAGRPTGTSVRAHDTSGVHASPPSIPTPTANFDGITADGVAPPDNDGAAGTTQYLEVVNSEFEVFSKT